jgi:pyruvate dehydrogenase E1 component alpha subunit
MREAQQAHRSAIKKLGPLPSLPSRAGLLRIFETMVRIRTFEEQAWKSALDGEGLPIHPSTGHEAIAAGVCSALQRGDKVVSNHRPFGHFIAKGGSMNELMAELYGRSTGVCKGLGGEMVLSDPSIGFVFSSMIVGACITISTGVAFALKAKASRSIAVSFFGEAATTNGAFHEALTMASLYRLPLLFVCENNGYSTNTPALEYMPTEMASDRASGYGFPTAVVDGSDALAVREAALRAIWRIKHGGGPYFLEALASRIGPHKQILVDTRTKERATYARMHDPIVRYRASLVSEKFLDGGTEDRIRRRVAGEVRDAVRFARKGKTLTRDELSGYLFANRP